MNQDVKREWIEALRSGRYKKGKNYLHINDCFCALGVLCDLYLQDIKKNWSKTGLCELPCPKRQSFLPKELLSIPKNSESYILAIGGLPGSRGQNHGYKILCMCLAWFSLFVAVSTSLLYHSQSQVARRIPYLKGGDFPRHGCVKKMTSVVELNDRWTGDSFDRIADLIEENL